MNVVLIRHTSVAVPKGTCYGWSDVPVADSFAQEAAQTRQQLEHYRFDAVYASPLTRARKLADFCGYPAPILDERLKEMNMGDWEMLRYDEIKDPALQTWFDDYMHLAATNGESFPQLYARVANFLDHLRTTPHQCVGIFAHGGVLICAGIYAGLFPPENCFTHLVPFGGVQEISI